MIEGLKNAIGDMCRIWLGLFAVFALCVSGPARAAPNLPILAKDHLAHRNAVVLANAEPAGDHGGKKEVEEKGEAEPEIEVPPKTPAEEYCSNVQEAAAAARNALQQKVIEEARAKLDERMKKLEEVAAEAKAWLKKREEFQNKATALVTDIYTKMPPEAAAARLLVMNEMIAVAILSKLPPKTAGAILAEIESPKAARLSSMLAGVADLMENNRPKDKERP